MCSVRLTADQQNRSREIALDLSQAACQLRWGHVSLVVKGVVSLSRSKIIPGATISVQHWHCLQDTRGNYICSAFQYVSQGLPLTITEFPDVCSHASRQVIRLLGS